LLSKSHGLTAALVVSKFVTLLVMNLNALCSAA
jgi:hypothetical protein